MIIVLLATNGSLDIYYYDYACHIVVLLGMKVHLRPYHKAPTYNLCPETFAQSVCSYYNRLTQPTQARL
jgi:hypothetical protein